MLGAPAKLDDALQGDEEAAWEFRCANTDPFGLGHAALAAYWLGTPVPAYQVLLRAGWSDDWLSMTKAVTGDRRLIRRVFRAARFEHTIDAGVIPVYRGASGVDLAEASTGISWTTRRDVACWFAYRYPQRPGEPIELSAHIHTSRIIYYDDDRFEAEVILNRPIRASVDSDPSSWRAAMERYAGTIR